MGDALQGTGATAPQRTLGLLRATGVGVGAIVGGGILALAGVAFETTGPSAIVAFALNGMIAFLTALSFAEMSTAFPESGGTYTFAKKVFSVEAAFMVGWVVWFASIVAGVLYALGFAAYATIVLEWFWGAAAGALPAWLGRHWVKLVLAGGATIAFSAGLVRRSGGGGEWSTMGKMVVFAVLIAGGLWAFGVRPPGPLNLRPFFIAGGVGLLQAMGYTFIALQGFDLIAAVAGEVRDPERVLPRSMLLSLAIALAVYLPLLFIIATVGMRPGQSVADASAAEPATVMATAVANYLGPLGFWLVIVAAILSMLSGLQANLFAASRVAYAMARDRTLPRMLERLHPRRGTPVAAVVASASMLGALLFVLPDVAAAGAAASLIFLVSFALAHWTNILARRRGGVREVPFRVPWFPAIPVTGGLACLALAVFQGIAVPSAGVIASVWLGCGGLLFLSLFARRARIVDARAEALDPLLLQLRGRNPLVLVPIANPASAEVMVVVASALAPPAGGRVLLLSVVTPPESWNPEAPPPQLADAQRVLGGALTASFAAGLSPEALTTVSTRPWKEIARVARLHRCESLLLGLSNLAEHAVSGQMEDLVSQVDCDVVVLRAPPGWRFPDARRILVPTGGLGGHDVLLARLLGSLCRTGARDVTFLRVLPQATSPAAQEDARRELARFAADEIREPSSVEVVRSDAVAAEIVGRAEESDLVILGLRRLGRHRKLFGDVALSIARESSCAVIMISRRG